ncbi:MAG: MFS transporter [Desulfobacterales bacterium]|nr:MFS transporter [Desulfobacterales bacterium]
MYDARTKRAALTVAMISAFVTPFMSSSINIAIPSIGQEFRADAVLLSWIATAYLLAAVASLVPFGRLADIHGRKRFFIYGTAVYTGASFLCAVSSSVSLLIAFRVVQGIGNAMVLATSLAIITSVYPPSERGKVMGLIVATVYTGLSVGPLVGGLLTHYFTWRSIFLVNIPLGLTIISLVLWTLKGEWAEAKGEKFDLMGAVIYCVGIITLIYGLSSLPGFPGLGLILIGVLALSAFVKWEARTESPVFHLNLFRKNRVFAFSNLSALINYSASFAVTFLLSLYLQQIRGHSAQAAGLILIAQPVVMAAVSPIAGRLSDRIEARVVASVGMALTTIGLLFFTLLKQDSTTGFIIVGLVILGLGAAFFASPNMNAIMGSVEKRFYGLASGSAGTTRLLGMVFSMGISTFVFSLFLGRVQITPQYHPAYVRAVSTAFIIFSCLCFGGIFTSAVRGNSGHGISKEPASAQPKP